MALRSSRSAWRSSRRRAAALISRGSFLLVSFFAGLPETLGVLRGAGLLAAEAPRRRAKKPGASAFWRARFLGVAAARRLRVSGFA
jgi:hypothetical protein